MENVFVEEMIKLDYPAVDKKSLLQEMVSFLFEKGAVASIDDFFAEIWKRENIMSTGMGRAVAIPHSCHESARRFIVTFWRLAQPLDFDSIDEKPVSFIFMVSVPRDFQSKYMKLLSSISNFARQSGKIDQIRSASSVNEVLKILKTITC